jgi:hypothetical protein
MSIQQKIQDLASQFAASILESIRSTSLEELLAAAPSLTREPRAQVARRGGRGGRLPRRTVADIEKVSANIIQLLENEPKGLRAEEIRQALQLEAKELPKPLAAALESGRVTKSGQKRATTYRLASSKPAKKKPTKATKKTAAKKPAKTKGAKKPVAKKPARKPAKAKAAKTLNGAAVAHQ